MRRQHGGNFAPVWGVTSHRPVESGGPVLCVRHGIFPRKLAPAGRKIPVQPDALPYDVTEYSDPRPMDHER